MAEQHYFLIAPGEGQRDVIILDGDEFRHCVKVCRARVGDVVKLLDGRGRIIDARIEHVGQREARLGVLDVTTVAGPAPVDIALGMLKAPRLDLALEKCTELGLRKLVVFASARSTRRVERDDDGARLERMKRKLAAACKQSGQPHLPDVELVHGFEGLIERLSPYAHIFLADQESKRMTTNLARGAGAVLGIIGPEGGLDPEERGALLRHGAVPLGLGPTRLRSETAAICLLYRLSSDMRALCTGG